MKRTFLLIGTLLLTVGSAFAYSMPRWGMTSVDVYLPEHQYSDIVRSAFEEWAMLLYQYLLSCYHQLL